MQKKRKILYLHGWQGSVDTGKRAILETYSKLLIAPENWYEVKNPFSHWREVVIENKLDLLIGNSFGGMTAWALSNSLQLQAILFNPAPPGPVHPLWEHINAPELTPPYSKHKIIILGLQDTVIPPEKTLEWAAEVGDSFEKIIRYPEVEHRIPVLVFEQVLKEVLD